MKKFLLCLALLIGFSDGSIIAFLGYPSITITPTAITVEGVPFPIEVVTDLRYVPDSAVI